MEAERRRTESIPLVNESFDVARQLGDKSFRSACYAPTVSMYFDQKGNVRACCQNTGQLLGSVTRQSIREIWEGAAAQELRAAVTSYDFSRGCGFCGWQATERGESPFARWFDRYAVKETLPTWPTQMEFALTNTCNLQCVMCNGDWSSSIRAHRERRAPLPEVYDESFFEQLAEFLPHLRQVNFIGGEPFMGREPLRVMEMMIDLGLEIPITVTTNATHWTPRIERICSELPISFVVSLDGITKETYESIRVGADFDRVMANIDRFVSIVEGTDRTVALAHCLMTSNWSEFIDLLLFAEAMTAITSVGVNSVVFPRSLSLFQLAGEDLADVVDAMEAQGRERAGVLRRFRPVWDDQLQVLRSRVAAIASGSQLLDPWTDDQASFEPETDDSVRRLVEWCGHVPFRIRCSPGWRSIGDEEVIRPIVEVDPDFARAVDIDPSELLGRPLSGVTECLARKFGVQQPVREVSVGTHNHFEVRFHGSDGRIHEAQSLLVEEGDHSVVLVGVRQQPAAR